MKGFYIYTHTHLYTYHRLFSPLPLTHTYRLSHSLSCPRKLHTHCGYDNSSPPPPSPPPPATSTPFPTLSLPIRLRLPFLSAKVSALLFICVLPSVSTSVTACVCAGDCETSGAEPSNGHTPNTPMHANDHCEVGFHERHALITTS